MAICRFSEIQKFFIFPKMPYPPAACSETKIKLAENTWLG